MGFWRRPTYSTLLIKLAAPPEVGHRLRNEPSKNGIKEEGLVVSSGTSSAVMTRCGVFLIGWHVEV